MKNERDFKGIWIPKDIWLNENLTLQEKVFLVEIDSLDNQIGCFATNDYFAKFFGLSKIRVSNVINGLVRKKEITSEMIYVKGSKQIDKRVLKVSLRGSYRKVYDPIKEKFKDNNTVNNTSNNKVTIREKFKNEILEDKEHQAVTCMALKIKKENYISNIETFILSSAATGKDTWKDYQDFKSHYFYWLKNENSDGKNNQSQRVQSKQGANLKSPYEVERERIRAKYIGNV